MSQILWTLGLVVRTAIGRIHQMYLHSVCGVPMLRRSVEDIQFVIRSSSSLCPVLLVQSSAIMQRLPNARIPGQACWGIARPQAISHAGHQLQHLLKGRSGAGASPTTLHWSWKYVPVYLL